jgi:hypothetical protein
MLPWYPASTSACTAGRRCRTGGPWRSLGRYGVDKRRRAAREDSKEPRGVGAWGRHDLGWWAALGGAWCGRRGRPARGARARATSRRGGALVQFVLPITSLKLNFSKILYTSAPNVEYESCTSSYPLPLSKRLYSVFLNRFCMEGLPTLNVAQLP